MFRSTSFGLLALSMALLAAPTGADENPKIGSEEKSKESAEMKYKPRRNFSDALQVGDEAPQFSLKALHGDDVFNLADYRGEKPVVLFFGSYT